ncbi:MAG TPA: MBL fold metallo-hydrolase [Hyphomicrobiaceae bacterium]|nr:MBL fold metallo-hydrolase [Hyphomicrobiaceae bacterium]
MRILLRMVVALLAAASCALSADVALAAERCIGMAEAPGRGGTPAIIRTSFREVNLKRTEVRITYVGHSTFVIESAAGIRAATDYNDYVRPAELPDVVTMNRAHNTHYTDVPDPRIKHVLRGWDPKGGAAAHDVTVSDMHVRNVATNIRYGGETYEFGNSIFIFEVADLCIGHLGHLHHTLTTQQLAQIGQLDIVLVPVDGSFTMDLDGMMETLKTLKARLMLPMHYFSPYTLERFLTRARAEFEVEIEARPTIVISRATLPKRPTLRVLPDR